MAALTLTGSLLGGAYRVGQLLGEGGMGWVYEGTQEALNRRVAIKVLKIQGSAPSSQATLTRFAREARAAAELGHPNIVQVTDFQWRDGEPPFLVMERLVGQSLRELISRERRLPEARMAFVANQILDALGAAHRAGIVHRDIKPDNVFLTRLANIDDIVKVLDFGVAKHASEGQLTAHGARMGSPAYMSPEQAIGGAVDARTDLYCLGATMYHALTGRLPFDTTSLAELLEWIASRPPPPMALHVPDIDPRMAALVERAMAKDPSTRFQTADEMKAALDPFLRPRDSWVKPVAPALPLEHERVSHVPYSVSSGPLGRPMAVGVPPVVAGPLVPPAGSPQNVGTGPGLSPFARSAAAPPAQMHAYGPPAGALAYASPRADGTGPQPSYGAAYATGAYAGAATEGASAWKIAAGIAVWKLSIFFVLAGLLVVIGAIVAFFALR